MGVVVLYRTDMVDRKLYLALGGGERSPGC